MSVTQHLQSSLAACSNLLPQLVTTCLSYCLWWHPAAPLRAFEKTFDFTVCQAGYLISFVSSILGESIVWMCSANMQVFSTGAVTYCVWIACVCVCGCVSRCTQHSRCAVCDLNSPLLQAKDLRRCSRGRSWTTMSGTLWRWCDEARVCSCLWIMSQWKVSCVQHTGG